MIENKEITPAILKAFEIFKIKKGFKSDRAMCLHFTVPVTTYGNWKHLRSDTIDSEWWKVIGPELEECIKEAEQEILKDEIENGELLGSYEKYTVTISANSRKELNLVKKIIDSVAELSHISSDKGLDNIQEEEQEPTINFEVAESSIPYMLQQVSAGNGVEVLDERYHNKQDMQILEVTGESMQPTYEDGERVVVHLFQERVTFGDEHIPIEFVKNIVPEDSIILYNRNDEGLAMKRVKYEKRQEAWYFKLTADNTDWARQNKFKRIVKKTDSFVIFGKVIGKEK
jgi:hypothetical protein